MDRKVGLESNPTFLSTSDLAQDADPAGTAAGAGRAPDSGSIQNEPPKLDPDVTYVRSVPRRAIYTKLESLLAAAIY